MVLGAFKRFASVVNIRVKCEGTLSSVKFIFDYEAFTLSGVLSIHDNACINQEVNCRLSAMTSSFGAPGVSFILQHAAL